MSGLVVVSPAALARGITLGFTKRNVPLELAEHLIASGVVTARPPLHEEIAALADDPEAQFLLRGRHDGDGALLDLAAHVEGGKP